MSLPWDQATRLCVELTCPGHSDVSRDKNDKKKERKREKDILMRFLLINLFIYYTIRFYLLYFYM